MVETYRPDNLEEALKIRNSEKAIPFAGGTDLMVKYKSWTGTLPKFPLPLIFLGHLSELICIEKHKDFVSIGASTTLSTIEYDKRIPVHLRKAISMMAAPPIRNIATIGGNIGNASPAGDTICPLITLDTCITLNSLNASRRILLKDFIMGPGRTLLKDNEIITKIDIPLKTYNIELYRKVGTRKANALSKLSFSGVASISNNKIDKIHISVGAVAPIVVRSNEIEKKIIGLRLNEVKSKKEEIIQGYSALIKPIDDQRSTSTYRKKVSINILKYFLTIITNKMDKNKNLC